MNLSWIVTSQKPKRRVIETRQVAFFRTSFIMCSRLLFLIYLVLSSALLSFRCKDIITIITTYIVFMRSFVDVFVVRWSEVDRCVSPVDVVPLWMPLLNSHVDESYDDDEEDTQGDDRTDNRRHGWRKASFALNCRKTVMIAGGKMKRIFYWTRLDNFITRHCRLHETYFRRVSLRVFRKKLYILLETANLNHLTNNSIFSFF